MNNKPFTLTAKQMLLQSQGTIMGEDETIYIPTDLDLIKQLTAIVETIVNEQSQMKRDIANLQHLVQVQQATINSQQRVIEEFLI